MESILDAGQAQAAAARAELEAQHHHSHDGCDFCGHLGDDEEDELTRDSNTIVDLVHDGKLDEAEQAARDLPQKYREVHDGYDRLTCSESLRALLH